MIYIVMAALLLPLLLMLVITYLSDPVLRRFWLGWTLVVLSIVCFIAAWAMYYDMYHRPKVGVLGSRLLERTFWEAQSVSIVIAVVSFIQGIVFISIGRYEASKKKRKHVTRSASKSQ